MADNDRYLSEGIVKALVRQDRSEPLVDGRNLGQSPAAQSVAGMIRLLRELSMISDEQLRDRLRGVVLGATDIPDAYARMESILSEAGQSSDAAKGKGEAGGSGSPGEGESSV